MQCPGLQHPAVRAYQQHQRATGGRQCGVDPAHRCDLGRCRFWQVPRQQVYVCTASLHIHACSNRGCALAIQQHDRSGTGFRVCPLSGIEMSNVDYVAGGPEKVTGRGGVRWMQSGVQVGSTSTRRRRKPANPDKRMQRNFTPHRVGTLLLAIAHAQKYSLPGTVARVLRKTANRCNFAVVMSAVIVASGLPTLSPPPPPQLVDRITSYCRRMLPIVLQNGRHISPNTLVAVVLSLLATGLVANEVEVFAVDAWAAQHAPPLPLYAAVPTLQCRSMSACTRALKAAIFKDGVVVPTYVFPTQ